MYFIPFFLAKSLTLFCGTLVRKHRYTMFSKLCAIITVLELNSNTVGTLLWNVIPRKVTERRDLIGGVDGLQQDRQCRYKCTIEARSRNHCCTGQAIIVKYSLCAMHRAGAIFSSVAWPALKYFSTLPITS